MALPEIERLGFDRMLPGSTRMSIVWELGHELPARLLHLARRTVL
ncbi:hypothetical protein [Thioalkalivibrio sp. AKL6]|nr:hypothetical protein [Thioalkalivibrio sp. AKL6]